MGSDHTRSPLLVSERGYLVLEHHVYWYIVHVHPDFEQKIIDKLNAVQGLPTDIGGYYHPDKEKISKMMCPSATFNEALTSIR